MDNKDKIIREQREEIRLLNEEIKCLQLLLSQAGIPYGKGIQEKERPAALQKDSVMSETETVREQFIIPETVTQKHAQYFYSFFKGRKDVYSKRAGKPNPKTGKTGYYTQCWNYWKPGICPKYEKKENKMCGLPGTALQRAYRQSDHAAFDRCKRRLFGRDRRLPYAA